MASNVFLYRMPAGIPGAVNREQEHTGEPNTLDVSNPPLAYGDPVKMGANGKIQALAGGDTAAAIYGWLERPFPAQQAGTYGLGINPAYGNAVPTPGSQCTVMKRGYMTLKMQGATAAAKGGAVFVRIAGTVPTGGRLSGVEAVVDGTAANTPSPANTYFMGAADSDGNVEIAYNL